MFFNQDFALWNVQKCGDKSATTLIGETRLQSSKSPGTNDDREDSEITPADLKMIQIHEF